MLIQMSYCNSVGWNDSGSPQIKTKTMILNGIGLRSHLNSSNMCFCLITPKHLALFCGTDFKFYFRLF